MNRSEELKSGYKKTSVLAEDERGIRKCLISPVQRTQATP